MMLVWILILLATVSITIWATIRKKEAGLPLILGVWLLLLVAYLSLKWFPPLPGQILIIAFTAGISICLIVWGLVNILIQLKYYSLEYTIRKNLGHEYFMVLQKPKGHYGVLYGYVPWDSDGAEFFHSFVNENIWFKGLKLTQLNIELEVRSSALRIAWVWGLIEPKTIIDRILY